MRLRALLPALLLTFPLTAAAQFAPSTEAFSLSTSPTYPAPHSTATVTALSASINLSSATMNVSVNGKETYRGTVQPVSIALGRAGEVANVRVAITAGGQSYSQTVTIVPQDVLLIPEPLSSAPALYGGKPAIPLEGRVRVVAFANLRSPAGVAANPSSLAYTWTVDGVRQAAASGVGKATLVVSSPLQYRDRTVSVTVQNEDGSLMGGASYSLTPQPPLVRLYENDPLLGIRFERALPETYAIAGSEASLYGAAYSFPGVPALQWFLNGTSVQTGPVVTLRPTGTGVGRASLSFVAAVGELARTTTALSLTFGAAKSTNFFGL